MTPLIDWERLARHYVHPTRLGVLDVLALDGGRVLSPNELRRELNEDISNVSYHVNELVGGSFLVLMATAQRRGAVEHFYALAGWEVC
jgi:DNA-binding MarR family transcriptional regulator